MGDIGNVDADLVVAIVEFARVQRIVNIGTSGRVNWCNVILSQILSFGQFFGRNWPALVGQTGEHGRGEGIVFDIVLEQEYLVFRFLVANIAEYLLKVGLKKIKFGKVRNNN